MSPVRPAARVTTAPVATPDTTTAPALPEPVAPPVTTPAGTRLLDAAEDLFTVRGIGAVGVDLVADTAEVTKRTLYQRFGSKEELVAAALTRRAHRWQRRLVEQVGRADDPTDRVLAVFAVAEEWAGRNPRGCAFVNAWAEVEPTGGTALDAVRAEKEWMATLFRALVDDEELAARLHLLYEGALVTAAVLRDPTAHRQAREAAAGLLGVRVTA